MLVKQPLALPPRFINTKMFYQINNQTNNVWSCKKNLRKHCKILNFPRDTNDKSTMRCWIEDRWRSWIIDFETTISREINITANKLVNHLMIERKKSDNKQLVH